MLTSASAPPRAPKLAPIAALGADQEDHPISASQNVPEQAPDAAGETAD